jgi:hypothetical protein
VKCNDKTICRGELGFYGIRELRHYEEKVLAVRIV